MALLERFLAQEAAQGEFRVGLVVGDGLKARGVGARFLLGELEALAHGVLVHPVDDFAVPALADAAVELPGLPGEGAGGAE